ncbi:hypothetical protein C8F01DRAFT_701416 [Mycena amicta]|nr:hypothetical protein C8F01DRAFT_701416 [Mycena amicta]
MATSARASSSATPLRRRTYIMTTKRASSTGSSTLRPEELTDQEHDTLPSPPTSFVDESPDEEMDQYADDEEEQNTARDFAASPEVDLDLEENEGDDGYAHRPWYKPSLPVLLALAPPLGNWLTGGDHLKDLLLLLLLVFYLHQIVELPWTLYHNARPRRSLAPSASEPHISSIQARTELRRLEIFLLLVCLVTPTLGVVLLRSLTSTGPHTGPHPQRQPISWFSTSIFALLTALRPLRELVSLIATRTSTLHTRVHSGPVHLQESASGEEASELAALRAEVALLSSRLDTLSQSPSRKSASSPQITTLTNRLDALTALVSSHSELLPLLEDGVRRLERRVGRLRAGRKAQLTPAGTTANTIFVPAPTRPLPFLSWLFPQQAPAPVSAVSVQTSAPPLSPSSSKLRSPLAMGLASIPEESEPASAAYPPATIHAYRAQQVHSGYGGGAAALEMLTRLALAPLQLLLLPLYLLLLPLRGVLRALVR